MGSRKRVKYEADVIDSMRSDWHISDDGDDRGPIDSWSGSPFLGSDDGSNAVPRRELHRQGSRSGMSFVGPIPHMLPRRTFFDDGGLNVEGRRRNIARDAFAEQRNVDALFSRTAVGGDAYAFLRNTDPGSDNTYAPRRGPYQSISTSATMSGAGYFFAVSDAAGAGSDRLSPGEVLLPGQKLVSRNGRFRLEFQRDGNLVLYSGSAALWDSATVRRGAKAIQQKDGNFVVYSANGAPVFTVATQGHPGAILVLQDDANLVVYQGKTPLWNSGTWGGVKAGTHDSKSFLQQIGSAVTSVGEGVFSAVKTVGGSLAQLTASPALLGLQIAKGKNVFESLKGQIQDNLKAAQTIAPYAQAVLSVVPGVGQGVNAAIAAGNALAHGQPITDALVAGVKGMVPGGPLAQQALDTAYNLAKGQSITDAALAAARQNLPPGPAQMAFDTGLALAHGQSVQQVAKEKGMNLLQTAVSQLAPNATRAMSSVGPRIGQVVGTAVSVVPQNVKQAAQALLQNPSLRSLPVSDVARRLGLPERDVQHAVASVVQAAQRTGIGQAVRQLAPAPQIAERMGNLSFDRSLARFGSRMAPIALGHNRSAPRILPRYPKLMPGAMGLQDAGAFSTIKLGSTGADVQAWQRILGVAADGKFGPQTDAATRAWQRSHGLTADGVVGPKTWAAASTSVPASVPSSTPGPGTVTIPEVVVTATPPPPLTPTQVAAAASMPTIRLGSTGAPVQTWQGILRRDSGISGFTGALDGKFGPQTDAATRAWQRSSGLAADGVVGPNTWKKAIGSLTTPPLPGEKSPGVPLPTPVPPGLPPGLPPVPTTPVGGPPPIVTMPPVGLPPIVSPPPIPPIVTLPPSTGVTTPPPPPPGQVDKAGGAVAALALGALVAKMAGIF